jgi:polysaccharide export outer membrane protein
MMSFVRPRFRGSRFGRAALIYLAAGAVPALPGCVSARTDQAIRIEPEVMQSATRVRKEYVLGPGDEIDIVVRRTPEVSRPVAVRPDGYVTLPLFDDVMAAGLTPSELDAKLTELFAGRLRDPEVSVIATKVREPVVYVIGEVKNPAVLALRDAPTAMQAIALAGGLSRSAARNDVAVIRVGEDGYIRAHVAGVKAGGQPGPYMALATLPLQADDFVFVPEGGRSQVARFINEMIVQPLQPINLGLAIAANVRIVQQLGR